MGDARITAPKWNLVQVGRVVLFNNGLFEGRLATIVEIIDHKRILVEGPASDAKHIVPRHAAALNNVSLTTILIRKLPRAAHSGPIKKKWIAAKVEAIWQASGGAKKRDQMARRKALTDFERFKVMRLKKQARFEVRKSLAKVRAATK